MSTPTNHTHRAVVYSDRAIRDGHQTPVTFDTFDAEDPQWDDPLASGGRMSPDQIAGALFSDYDRTHPKRQRQESETTTALPL